MEETYTTDLRTLDDRQRKLSALVEQLTARVEHAHTGNIIHKACVKFRFADSRDTTVECVPPQVSLPVFSKLLAQEFKRRGIPVRLLGVGVRLYESSAHTRQQLLFTEDPAAVD